MRQYRLKVSPEEAGMRLDLFLTEYAKDNQLGFSRTFIQKSILEGRVMQGNLVLVKPNYKVRPDEEIRLILEEKKADTLVAEDMPLDIVYEDEDLAIINKPCGLVVHQAPGNYAHTLVNALLHHFKHLSDINAQRPGIVHRLDKETSGLLVIAKNNFSHLELAKQFAEHSIKRKYIAIVKGKMEFDEQVIELPIVRHPLKRKSMSVGFGKEARYAKTHYRTLRRRGNYSLLELEPFTGRTHQLRVHLAFLGHPILGDSKYGKNDEFIRLALHAQALGFIHPRSSKFLEFSCDLPKEFQDFLAKDKA